MALRDQGEGRGPPLRKASVRKPYLGRDLKEERMMSE